MTCWVSGVTGHPRPAAYLWHAAVGNQIPLCGPCCAAWRANVEMHGFDPPVKIEEL